MLNHFLNFYFIFTPCTPRVFHAFYILQPIYFKGNLKKALSKIMNNAF